MVRHRYRRAWDYCALIVLISLFGIERSVFSAVETEVMPTVSTNQQDSGQIGAKADRLNYDRTSGWIEGIGHVVITKGDEKLQADYIKVHVDTQDAEAVGDVVLSKMVPIGTNVVSTNAISIDQAATNHVASEWVTVWTGNKLKYNFKTKRGSAANMTYDMRPFFVRAKSAQQVSQKKYRFKDTTITTCTNSFPNYHYYVSASDTDVVQKESMKAHNAFFRIGSVPIFYLPYWYKSLSDDFGFRFYPGYNSRMGAFLLTLYRYRINPYLNSVTHLDYRSKRGLAYGQDFEWKDPVTNAWNGVLSGYFLNDKDPTQEGDRDPEDVEESRYRIQLRHNQNFSDRDYLLSQGQYLSDPYLNMDFFEDEYRDANQPDNYVAYTHRGDLFTGNLLLRSRLNDFYSTVNRLPEVSFDFMRQEVGNTVFYYDGQTAAAFLQKTYEKTDTNHQEYSAFRIDSSHMFYYPNKYFGFLNIMPRAGYRATYYSKTKQETTLVTTGMTTRADTTVDPVGRTNTTYVSVLGTNSETTILEGPSKLRSRFELGTEASFKAFRTWDDEFGGWRHVVEPYANYTFVPEPSLLSDELYQFDNIDKFGEEHWVRFGIRNKLQTKVDGSPYDLVDFDIYTRYLFERGDRSTALDNIYFELKTWPAERFTLFFDGMYDTDQSVLSMFNTRLNYSYTDFYNIYLEHRYTEAGGNLLYGGMSFSPNRYWTFEVYGRNDFENSRFEEGWLYISKKTDCLTFRTGAGIMPGYTRSDGVEEDDEYRFVVELWLNAFPDMAMGKRHRN
ncbi:MAG: LptA/OstA family protein [Kiritimatiellae bacterium]|nr:LptA/OstA family protein [Kiritimatiellia bacterium]MDD5521332.1 LptA/OstA family protein [Kiritimatiellia bacterium]